MRFTSLRRVALLLVTAVVLVVGATAQESVTGGIAGNVKDPSGAMVAGATIEVYNEQTAALERRFTTGADGAYAFTAIRPGAHRLEVSAQGFRKYRSLIPVSVGETARHDVVLQVGGAQEIVNVEATQTLVNTESAVTGQPVDSRMLANLPTPSPNYLYLLTLSTGVAGEPGDPRPAGRGNVDINVNGQRTTNNNALLEGINVNDFNLAHFDTIPLPNPNAIQEFKVATSLYDATTGSKGGGSVNTVLRTGSKDWHGTAYWQHRNDAFNAREWFYNRDNPGAPKQKLLQNVLGFSASGPVPVPVLRGFFFANAQGVRYRNGVDPSGAVANPTAIPVLPTASDGSTSAASLAQLLPQGLQDPANIDPVAVSFLNLKSDFYHGSYYFPRSGQSGCGNRTLSSTVSPVYNGPGNTPVRTVLTCTFSRVIPGEAMQYTITWDRPLRGGKDRLSLRGFNDNGEAKLPYGAGGTLSEPTANKQRNRFATISYTTQISNRQLNEFRFGFSRFNSSFAPTDIVTLSDIGSSRPNQAVIPGVWNASVTGLFSFGTGANDDRGTIQNSFTWSDTWSMVKGRHTFRAGTEINRFQLNRYNNFAVRGILTFGTIGSGTGCGITLSTCILPFQAFLMGRPTALQSAAGIPNRYFRDTDLAAFFQDDLRLTPRLTLNLGLRWEGLGMGTELYNRIANYYPDFAAAGKNPFVFPKDVNVGGFTGIGADNAVDNCVIDNCRQNKNIAPRVGFAYDLFGNHKTVIRGGYGIYFQRLSNQTTLQTSLAPPFNVQPIESRPDGLPALQLANPFPSLPVPALVNLALTPQRSIFTGLRYITSTNCPAPAPAVLNVNDPCVGPTFTNEAGELCANFGGSAPNCSINFAAFTTPPRNFRTPYNQQWNLTVQRDIAGGWALEVGYVGAHFVRGIGIFSDLIKLAAPAQTDVVPGLITAGPITVTDSAGRSYTITTNTQPNVPLRSPVLGLDRSRGARFNGNVGYAHYNALQTTLLHRFAHGLYFQAAYTWAKTIDNVSGSQSTDELNVTRNGQGGANLFDFGNIVPNLNRALSDFDRRHRLAISYSYDLPMPKSGIWGSPAFQGWTISGITYFQSGLPFTPTADSAGAWGSGGLASPIFLCSSADAAYTQGSIQSRVNGYLNSSCFANTPNAPNIATVGGAALRNYGTTRRNAFRGPFQQDFDFSVGKSFTFVERHTLKFRADFFNMFNHPIFRAPSGVSIATPATFGQITQTVIPSRLIQMNLKYEF